MPWLWSRLTRDEEYQRRKDVDVAEVRKEVSQLMSELRSLVDEVERRSTGDGYSRS